MLPFGPIAGMSGNAPGPKTSPVGSESVPGLAPVQQIGVGVPSATPPAPKSAKGIPGLTTAEELEKVLVPVTAAAGAVLQPESPLGKKLLTIATGFKVGEAGSAVNKLTPGAALFLAPEPIGMLPERAFMQKPTIPGTGVYIDPLYNYTRYRARRDDRKRAAAGAAQLEALEQIIPNLTTEQLSRLRLDSALRARAIGFVDARVLDARLAQELDARRLGVSIAQGVTPAQRDEADRAAIAALLAEGSYALFAGDAAGFLDVSYALMGSLHPQHIDPIRNLAIASGEAAEGVRRDLASERADP